MAELDPKKTVIYPLSWWRSAITGTASITNMRVAGIDDNYNAYYHYVPFAGSIVAFELSSMIVAPGSGSLTARLLSGGTAKSGISAIAINSSASVGNTGYNVTQYARGTVTVSAGDRLQVVYTSHTFDAGASSAVLATVYLHVEQES